MNTWTVSDSGLSKAGKTLYTAINTEFEFKGTRVTQSKEKSSGITNRYHLLANITYCMYLLITNTTAVSI